MTVLYRLNGFTLLDSLVGLTLISSGLIFYLQTDQTIQQNLQKSQVQLIHARDKYESK